MTKRHLLDFKRGRASVYRCWTACGIAARCCFVARTLSYVNCQACATALRIKVLDAPCNCFHERRFHKNGRGACSKCRAEIGRTHCERFKHQEPA